jgi:hypothetical protein
MKNVLSIAAAVTVAGAVLIFTYCFLTRFEFHTGGIIFDRMTGNAQLLRDRLPDR